MTIGETSAEPVFVLAHFTVATASFAERVQAAAAAGYDGIGLNFIGYLEARDAGVGDDEMSALLDAHGQRILEVEALRGWSAQGVARQRSDRLAELAFHLADRFGVPYLQAIGPYEGTIEHAAAEFGVLCDRAAQHGMVVGLEFLPSISNITDVTTARRIVEAAGRPNGGVCIDAWHFIRGGAPWDALAALPPGIVRCVQLDDGALVPDDDDYLRDCMTNRQIPGDGEFELVRLIRALDEIGCTAPFSIEVINAEMQSRPAVEIAALALAASRGVVGAARA